MGLLRSEPELLSWPEEMANDTKVLPACRYSPYFTGHPAANLSFGQAAMAHVVGLLPLN